MSVLAAVAEPRATPSTILCLPPELLGMVSELHRISQADSSGKTFTELENPILEICRKMGQWAISNTLSSHPAAEVGAQYRCPRCKRKFRILRQAQRRQFRSRFGPISYNRPYGTCDHCKVSGAPMDWELGLPEMTLSIGLLKQVCHAAVMAGSFEDAHEIMKVHDMVDLSAKAVRSFAEGEGRLLAQERDGEAKAYRANRLEAAPPEKIPNLLVICADGGRVQTRNGFAQRRYESIAHAERQAIDPSRPERWKEDKIGVVYDAAAKPQIGAAREKYQGAKARMKTYAATMQPWAAFGWMLRLEAERRGYAKAKTKLFVADGARDIRDLKNEQFHEATFILDWAHAAQHLADCAKAAFGEGTEKAQRWYGEHRDMLWEGKRDEIIADIQKLSQQAGAPQEADPAGSPRKALHQNAHSYFPNNRDAIDYPNFRAKGWPIGSGVAEGAVKQFALRMKGSEKFWNGFEPEVEDSSKTGAEEMLALCALYHSEDGRWERHWEKRSRPRQW